MKPMHVAAVDPVNWKATSIFGTRYAPKKIRSMMTDVIEMKRLLSNEMGTDAGKRSPSKLRRRVK